MVPKRVRLAGVLDRLGLLTVLLEARARALLPWRWLTVLTFHRVATPGAPGFDPEVSDTTAEDLERQVLILKRYFNLIDTRDLDASRSGAPLPDNPALISFDDGYRDNYQHALPILRRLDAKAVFFIATGYVTERRLFWWERLNCVMERCRQDRLILRYPDELELDLGTDRSRRLATRALLRIVKDRFGLDLDRFLDETTRAAGVEWNAEEERRLADSLIVTWDHVRALAAAGMDIQSHGQRHRLLNTLSDDDTTKDLSAARHELEGQIDKPVFALAYPGGRGAVEHPGMRRAVRRAGYRIAFSNATGTLRLGGEIDWLGIPRIAMDRDMPDPFFRGCLAIPALNY